MTMHHDVEARLRHAFMREPSAEGMRRLDERVAQVMIRAAPQTRRWSPRGMVVRPAAVLAAFVLLTGAVAGTMTLLERLTTGSSVGVRAAWDRAEVVGISRNDAGVTVTLERAYADLNQVVLFLEVEGLPTRAGTTVPDDVDAVAQLRDPSGRHAETWAWAMGGSGSAEPDLAALIVSWDGAVTPEAGTWELTITTVGYGGMMDGSCTAGELADGVCAAREGARVDGRWTFEFPLPAPAGAVVQAEASDTDGMATIRLTELRLAPSAVSGRLYLDVDGSPVPSWAATITAIRHDSEAWQPETNPNYTARVVGAGAIEFMTSVGVEMPSGTWEIEISDVLVASDGAGDLGTPLDGHWVLRVVVP
jgi:hypothetical protein